MESFPKFLNGIFAYNGLGFDRPASLDPSLLYMVPGARRAQLVYLRAGNSGTELITVFLMSNGKAMRLFPIGAKSSLHVPLTVVEDLEPDTKIEVFVSAPAGARGEAVIDIGLLEI